MEETEKNFWQNLNKKLSKSIKMYISPISGEQLMGLESSVI